MKLKWFYTQKTAIRIQSATWNGMGISSVLFQWIFINAFCFPTKVKKEKLLKYVGRKSFSALCCCDDLVCVWVGVFTYYHIDIKIIYV